MGNREEVRLLREIARELREIRRILGNQYEVVIYQEDLMANGITAGATGTFLAQLLDNGVAVATQPSFTWSASDPSVTIAPGADTTSAVVTVPAGDTGTSVTITASATDPTGATQSGSITVPILPVPQQFTVVVTQTA